MALKHWLNDSGPKPKAVIRFAETEKKNKSNSKTFTSEKVSPLFK